MTGDRIIVGITGASGTAYGVRALELLRDAGIETHLVMSKAAHVTRTYESGLSRAEIEALADHVHRPGDIDAAISSGSFATRGMLIAPCSMRTLAEIASGASTSLVSRAADVVLKERRRLVLMAREAPLHLIHLRNMATVTEAGAIVFPPVPAMYAHPASIDDVITHSVARALDLFDVHVAGIPRWEGPG
ncbi:UbiX family flavin prenyltransferase [Demequina sp. SYSU T00039]|uniref:Flavin prenyltransferase UbiX n=1 Tax=Demequina lignilytica TaxID=3051663 RepID=A0AAW7M847_9MICO|nr:MULTISPECIES: UbiX family flavin prenyltransferase [unclassified Demequina]MDN4477531.1 UbiX family flavin prenyltransferase [Demequina sp. SYSU T00039-1]MDN4488118.1 UbiX family flavin prenyltransferase [Demequina sp. SYSU T00039]MDN4490559.1 UbiX family flavin prenyltransferase [Demequina sp. SYSU T00068]